MASKIDFYKRAVEHELLARRLPQNEIFARLVPTTCFDAALYYIRGFLAQHGLTQNITYSDIEHGIVSLSDSNALYYSYRALKDLAHEVRYRGRSVGAKEVTKSFDLLTKIRLPTFGNLTKDVDLSETENLDRLEEEFVALALVGKEIKLVSLTKDGQYTFLDQTDGMHAIVYVEQSDSYRLGIAVDELETLMNDAGVKESDFQDFFERYPEFILNEEYRKAHSKVVLSNDFDGDLLIPDFVLEPIDQNGLCDLLELKLPSADIFALRKNRMRFSAAVLEACAQLRTYAEFFDEDRNRKIILEKFGLLAYKPKMFVVIGRRGRLSPIELRKIACDLPQLSLRTYDDVLARMKSRLKKM
jgi:hypothetical protein